MRTNWTSSIERVYRKSARSDGTEVRNVPAGIFIGDMKFENEVLCGFQGSKGNTILVKIIDLDIEGIQ